jgi:hypothetical protein
VIADRPHLGQAWAVARGGSSINWSSFDFSAALPQIEFVLRRVPVLIASSPHHLLDIVGQNAGREATGRSRQRR